MINLKNKYIAEDVTSSKSPLRIELSSMLFDELAIVLNNVHNTNYSNRFWKLLTGDHVNAVISRKIKLDSRKILRNPDLYPINSFSFPSRSEKFKKTLIRTVKHFRNRKAENQIEAVLKENQEVHLGFPAVPEIENGELGARLPVYYPLFTGTGDLKKRETVNNMAEKYQDIYLQNVIRELPKILVEHFSALDNSIQLHQPEKKRFHVHLEGSFYMKFLIAKYTENGSQLVWYQHGSEYGENMHDSSHHFQSDVSDEFRTWGWKINSEDRPWKAYRLEKFRLSYESYKEKREYDLLICYPAMNVDKKAAMIEFTNQVLDGLDPAKYGKILARPRRSNKLHSHKSQLSFINDERVVKSTGLPLIQEEMKRCRMVLQLSVPSTNFLECLYVDFPTMGILVNKQPTPIVKPYYDFFLAKGVLHKNTDSLINFLNKIEIEQWWAELMSEPLYHEYKNMFARPVTD